MTIMIDSDAHGIHISCNKLLCVVRYACAASQQSSDMHKDGDACSTSQVTTVAAGCITISCMIGCLQGP